MIEQAKGVLAERLHVSVDQAFLLLRQEARSRNRRLSDLAQLVVDGSAQSPAATITPRAAPATDPGSFFDLVSGRRKRPESGARTAQIPPSRGTAIGPQVGGASGEPHPEA
jgi:hypothetical protein